MPPKTQHWRRSRRNTDRWRFSTILTASPRTRKKNRRRNSRRSPKPTKSSRIRKSGGSGSAGKSTSRISSGSARRGAPTRGTRSVSGSAAASRRSSPNCSAAPRRGGRGAADSAPPPGPISSTRPPSASSMRSPGPSLRFHSRGRRRVPPAAVGADPHREVAARVAVARGGSGPTRPSR